MTEKQIVSVNERTINNLKTKEVDANNKVVFNILANNVRHSEEPEEGQRFNVGRL